MMKTAVIGGGAWGTALAHILGEAGHNVEIWARESEVIESINSLSENTLFLNGLKINSSIRGNPCLDSVLQNADFIINTVPTQFIRSVWSSVTPETISDSKIIINASKGIEEGSLKLISQIFEELFPGIVDENFAVLSGPSFAEEVVKGYPTSVSIASMSSDLSEKLARLFHLNYFRLYSSNDIIGVQLGGALKNVMAIAAGAIDGMGLGLNTRAAMITRGLSEIARLGLEMGASGPTFSGLSGLGDLILTCTGNLSRNRQVGYRLGKGEPVKSILSGMNQVAEGVATSRSTFELSKLYNTDMPITRAVYSGVFQEEKAENALKDILARELKHDGI